MQLLPPRLSAVLAQLRLARQQFSAGKRQNKVSHKESKPSHTFCHDFFLCKKSGSYSDQPPLQGEFETWFGRSQWWSWSPASGTRSSSEWPAVQGGPGSSPPGGTAAADGQGGRRGTTSTDTVRTAGGPVQVRHRSWSMLVVSAMASILSNLVSLLPRLDLLSHLLSYVCR